MAEALDSAQATPEPSMEEILASIRKIISDDAPPTSEAAAPVQADVVELTQMVEDDGSVNTITASPPESVAPPSPPPLPPVLPRAPAPPPAEGLVSETSATAASSALSSLANTLEIDRLSSAPMTGTPLGNGARTLEDMAIELMRPLLKQWLDENLPATVDRLVQKEIERISRRIKD